MVYTVFQEIDLILAVSLLVQGLILIVMWALLRSISKHTKNLDRFGLAMETISDQLDNIGKTVSPTSRANVADELGKIDRI